MAALPAEVIAIIQGDRAWKREQELALGSEWNDDLVAPTTPFRPPMHAVSRAYLSAPAVTNPNMLAAGSCDDRSICDPGGPGPSPAHGCSDEVHNPAVFRFANGPGNIASRLTCLGGMRPAGYEHHPPGTDFHVCHYCMVHSFAQPWARAIINDIMTIPRPPTAIAPHPPQDLNTYTHFLTHLCVECEDFEEHVLAQRQLGFDYNVPARIRVEARTYPMTTCICGMMLRVLELCIRDRHDRACEDHDHALMTRQQNDAWLRTIERQPDGSLGQASPATVEARAARGVFRACRCGAEIQPRIQTRSMPRTYVPPRVYLCMGCEGIVHFAPPTGETRRHTRLYDKLEAELSATGRVYKLRRWT